MSVWMLQTLLCVCARTHARRARAHARGCARASWATFDLDCSLFETVSLPGEFLEGITHIWVIQMGLISPDLSHKEVSVMKNILLLPTSDLCSSFIVHFANKGLFIRVLPHERKTAAGDRKVSPIRKNKQGTLPFVFSFIVRPICLKVFSYYIHWVSYCDGVNSFWQ